MITATQIISGSVPAGQACAENTGGLAGLFEALYALALEGSGTAEADGGMAAQPKGGEKKDTAADTPTAESVCLAAAVYPGVFPGAAPVDTGQAETPAVLEGAAVTDILEGQNSSCDMDIAPQPAEGARQEQGGENEAIMARMPQITVIAEADEPVPQAEGNALQNGSPCPLENVGDSRAAGQEQQSAAETPGPAAGESAAQAVPAAAKTDLGSRNAAREETGNARPEPFREKTEPAEDRTAAPVSGPGTPVAYARETASDTVVRASVANAMQRLEEVLSAYNQPEDKRITIQLEPENLGKLSISLAMGKNGLTARINTENAEVQSVLSNQISQLIDKLGSSGIQVQRMDVLCSDMSFRQEQQFNGGDGSARRQSASGRIRASVGETSDYDAAGAYDLYVQSEENGSSVEYRA